MVWCAEKGREGEREGGREGGNVRREGARERASERKRERATEREVYNLATQTKWFVRFHPFLNAAKTKCEHSQRRYPLVVSYTAVLRYICNAIVAP
jgi:hypothetical protein